jgi:hypothetical protein
MHQYSLYATPSEAQLRPDGIGKVFTIGRAKGGGSAGQHWNFGAYRTSPMNIDSLSITTGSPWPRFALPCQTFTAGTTTSTE